MPKPLKPCGTLPAYTRGCRCDACRAAKAKETAKSAERNRERAKAWREANPEQARQTVKTWKDKNREKVRATGRKYQAKRQAENPEAVRANRRRFAQTDKGRLANRLARHTRRGAPSDREWVEILLRDPCSYCGAPGGEIDHIDPLADTGDGHWTNLTSACRRCNASKNDQRLLEFLAA